MSLINHFRLILNRQVKVNIFAPYTFLALSRFAGQKVENSMNLSKRFHSTKTDK
jgi:hypothetical protein